MIVWGYATLNVSLSTIYNISPFCCFLDPPCFDDSDIYPWSCLGQSFITSPYFSRLFPTLPLLLSALRCRHFTKPCWALPLLFSTMPNQTMPIHNNTLQDRYHAELHLAFPSLCHTSLFLSNASQYFAFLH